VEEEEEAMVVVTLVPIEWEGEEEDIAGKAAVR